MSGLLNGANVLDITDEHGAYATRLLGDLGAEVVRLIPSTGDRLMEGYPRDEERRLNFLYEFMNLNKRSVYCDIDDEPSTRKALSAATRWADIVVVSSTNHGPAGRFDISPLLPAEGPRVYVSICPFADQPGEYDGWSMDDLLYQALGGLMSLTGLPDREPLRLFGDQISYMAGIHAAGASLIGYYAAKRQERLVTVELSIFGTVLHTLETSLQFYTTTGEVRRRRGLAGQAGDGTYRCKDGVVVLAGASDPTFHQLLRWLVSEGVAVPSYMWDWDRETRRSEASSDEFRVLFEAYCEHLDAGELVRRARSGDVLMSPVNELPRVLADEQLAFERWFTPSPLNELGLVGFPGPPYRMGRASDGGRRPAPTPGADSEAFWTQLGIRPPELQMGR